MNGTRVNESKMNGSKVINRLRALASIAILSAAICTIFLLPAYGQQEVDPTWYDPMPATAGVHSAQAATTAHALQPVVTHRYLRNNQVSQTAQNSNSRAKNAKSDRSATSAAENTQTLAANKKTTLIASSK